MGSDRVGPGVCSRRARRDVYQHAPSHQGTPHVSDTPNGDTEPARAPKTGDASGRPIPGGMLALGSAVVLAVYGAGYFRTQEAAARFADEAVGRAAPRRTGSELAVATPPVPPPAAGALPNAVAGTPPAAKATSPVADVASKAPRKATASTPTVPKRAGNTTVADTATVVRQVAASKSAGSRTDTSKEQLTRFAEAPAVVTAAATSRPAPAPSAPLAVTTPAAPVSSAPVAPPAQAPAASAAPADTEHSLGLHDGTYTGWGTSRHGDIEATVVIKDGAIASATISRCLTRYSCSWISHLQAQVVKRQSPEVDYVSGATQSTNAFYYAVVEALGKAK